MEIKMEEEELQTRSVEEETEIMVEGGEIEVRAEEEEIEIKEEKWDGIIPSIIDSNRFMFP